MGRGDIKTRRGKISAGSHGKTRPRTSSKLTIPAATPTAPATTEEKA
ncbi:30S ribosomal protein THX [Spirosoma utsteinense]|nr:30S ribosomal protein THX [Spirosoma utsteinense]